MSVRLRLERLEKAMGHFGGCRGCAVRPITMPSEYQLPYGETITLPPYPGVSPCTCGCRSSRKPPITAVVFAPGKVDSREPAELHFVEPAKDGPWEHAMLHRLF